jgi:cell division septation protein DedD
MAQLLNAVFARRGAQPQLPQTVVASAEEPAAAEPAGDDAESAMGKKVARAVRTLSPVGTAQAATIAAPKPEPGEKYTLQLGAFSKQAAAEKAASGALAKLRMKGKTVVVAGPVRGDKEKLWRARLAGFSKGEAHQACRTLHKKHMSCSVVSPSATKLARS